MPKLDVLVQFEGEKGVDKKFLERCPRLQYREEDYFSLRTRLADERFNAQALNNLKRI